MNIDSKRRNKRIILIVSIIAVFAIITSTILGIVLSNRQEGVVTDESLHNAVTNDAFEIANAKMLDYSDLTDNGAIYGNDKKIEYNVNNLIDGMGNQRKDNEGDTTREIVSYFPNKYLELPAYGAYDLSVILQSSASENGWLAGCNYRLMGYESTPSIKVCGNQSVYMSDKLKSDWNEDKKGKGLYFVKDEGVATDNRSVIYFNVALPDRAVSNGSASISLSMDGMVFGTSERGEGWGENYYNILDAGIAIYAMDQQGNTGINAPFTNDNPTTDSIGFNYDNNFIDESGVNANMNPNGADEIANKSICNYMGKDPEMPINVGIDKAIIPSGTRYLRIAIFMENKIDPNVNNGYRNSKKLELLLTNLKIMLSDETNYTSDALDSEFIVSPYASETTFTNSHGASYTIPNGNDTANPADFATSAEGMTMRYVDLFMCAPNGIITRDTMLDAVNGLLIAYKDAEGEHRVPLSNLGVLGVDDVANDSIYIVEDHLENTNLKCNKFANLDGSISRTSGGIAMRIATKYNEIKIENNTFSVAPNGVSSEMEFNVNSEYTDLHIMGMELLYRNNPRALSVGTKTVQFTVTDSVKKVLVNGKEVAPQNSVYSLEFNEPSTATVTMQDGVGGEVVETINATNFLTAGKDVSIKILDDARAEITMINKDYGKRLLPPDIGSNIEEQYNSGVELVAVVRFDTTRDNSTIVNVNSEPISFNIEVATDKNGAVTTCKKTVQFGEYSLFDIPRVEGMMFVGLYNRYNLLLVGEEDLEPSQDASLLGKANVKIIMGGTMTLKYIVREAVTIKYYNANGRLTGIETYNAGTPEEIVKGVTPIDIPYMNFINWEVKGVADGIYEARPHFEPSDETFDVTINYADGSSEIQTKKFNDRILLHGKDAEFSGWAIGGTEVAKSDTYEFCVSADMTIDEIKGKTSGFGRIVTTAKLADVTTITGYLGDLTGISDVGFIMATGNTPDGDIVLEATTIRLVPVVSITRSGQILINVSTSGFKGVKIRMYGTKDGETLYSHIIVI